ncbi:MAG: DUF501 domain-containing protein [Actinomycetota bacterium]
MPPLEHADADERIVTAQLGRPLRGRWGVARRCHLGVPMVIENHPVLEDGAPFPTLFWLTCPVLIRRVARMEAEGYLRAVTERLSHDEVARSRLREALTRYRARRDEHAPVEDSGSPPGGGPDRIKCLHAHLAHELAAPPNPAGALALAAAGWPDCIEPCYAEAPS